MLLTRSPLQGPLAPALPCPIVRGSAASSLSIDPPLLLRETEERRGERMERLLFAVRRGHGMQEREREGAGVAWWLAAGPPRGGTEEGSAGRKFPDLDDGRGESTEVQVKKKKGGRGRG